MSDFKMTWRGWHWSLGACWYPAQLLVAKRHDGRGMTARIADCADSASSVCLWAAAVAVVLLALAGCGGSGGGSPAPPPAAAPPIVERTFDFAQGNGGWLGGHADYTMDTAPRDVLTEIRGLPAPFTGSGLQVSGTNRSDDLLIYVKTKISGLVAGTAYRVRATVEFLTDVPAGCVGVGGPPGESVWIIVGASTSEPQTLFNGSEYRLNIDRGNQSQGGREGIVLGNIANSVPNCGAPRWEAKTLSIPANATLTMRADERGEAWFLAGMDSGFESFSRIYIRRIALRLEPL